MKSTLAMMIVLTLSQSVSAQVKAVRAGSAEAARMLQADRQRIADNNARGSRLLDVGEALFGVDPRWTDVFTINGNPPAQLQSGLHASQAGQLPPIAGTLFHKHPRDFAIGDWGCIYVQFDVLSIMDKSTLLAFPGDSRNEPVAIKGFDTAKVTDGVKFILQHPVVIDSTLDYATAGGSSKRILVIERNQAAIAAKLQKLDDARYRTWKSADGDYSVRAVFVVFRGGKAKLQKQDGTTIDVPASKLSKEDNAFIREELARQKRERK